MDAGSTVVLFYKQLVGWGGAERQMWEEVAHLRARGCRAHVLTFSAQTTESVQDGVSPVVLTGATQLARLRALRCFVETVKPRVVSVHSGVIDVFLAMVGSSI